MSAAPSVPLGTDRPADEVDPARLGLRRPARRGVIAALSLVVGLLLGNAVPDAPSAAWFGASGVLALLAVLLRQRGGAPALVIAMVTFGGGWMSYRVFDVPDGDIQHLLSDEERLVVVEGVLTDTPRIEPAQRGRMALFSRVATEPVTRLTLRAHRVIPDSGPPIDVSGRLWVRIEGEANTWRAGDAVRVMGFARRIGPPSNPGAFDGRKWARQTGVAGRMRLATPELIVAADLDLTIIERAGGWWHRLLGALRMPARRLLEPKPTSDALPVAVPMQDGRGLLNALLLGRRDLATRDLDEAFLRLGLAHVLAISGLHLAIVAGLALLALRLLGDHPRLEPALLALVILLYMALVPARAPIMRAGIMILVFTLVELSGRRYDRINTLAWIMVALLLWRPLDLLSAGFQLTFGIVAALMLLSRPLRVRLFGPRPERDTLSTPGIAIEWTKESLSASICAWAVASPLVAYHMGIFSPLAPIMTLLVLPLVTAALGVGFVTIVIGIGLPELAGPILVMLHGIASTLAKLVLLLDGVPLTVINLPVVGVAWTIAATMTVVWWIRFGSLRRPAGVLATVIVVGWLVVAGARPSINPAVALRIDVLSVGDGSCYLVRSGRSTMLYDCGSLNWVRLGERDVPDALRALGVWRLDKLFISHPDLDHFAGIPDLLSRMRAEEFVVSSALVEQAGLEPDGGESVLMHHLRTSGTPIRTAFAGAQWRLGDATVSVISPRADVAWSDDRRAHNNASLVLLVEAPTVRGPRRAMICGDIEVEAMEGIMDQWPDLRADIVEAPHHGSAANSTAMTFVAWLEPEAVFQSTGPRRVGDERWAEVRARTRWFDTETNGALAITIGGDGSIEVRGVKSSAPVQDYSGRHSDAPP